eukprot:COSAG02_NODE_115_length_35467_cov_292.837056_5_plen_159_part_00
MAAMTLVQRSAEAVILHRPQLLIIIPLLQPRTSTTTCSRPSASTIRQPVRPAGQRQRQQKRRRRLLSSQPSCRSLLSSQPSCRSLLGSHTDPARYKVPYRRNARLLDDPHPAVAANQVPVGTSYYPSSIRVDIRSQVNLGNGTKSNQIKRPKNLAKSG